jgi:hypothetical protein
LNCSWLHLATQDKHASISGFELAGCGWATGHGPEAPNLEAPLSHVSKSTSNPGASCGYESAQACALGNCRPRPTWVASRSGSRISSRLLYGSHVDSSAFTAQGILILIIALGLASVPPILEYVTILRYDSNVNIIFAASILAGMGMSAILGITAYASMAPALLLGHAALTAITGASMTIMYTLVYIYAELRCASAQPSLAGCGYCACTATKPCNAVCIQST